MGFISNTTFTRIFFILVCVIFQFSAHAQIDSSEVNNSPYGVIYNHLYYLQDDSYDTEKAARSFAPSAKNKEDLAIQLKKVLDGKGYYIDINRLPQNTSYKDTTSGEAIYILNQNEPRIYVERIKGKWYYSRTTIDQVEPMFAEVFPLGAEFFEYFHGPFWDYKLLGIATAKWFGLLLMGFLCFIVFYIFRFIAGLIVKGFINKRLTLLKPVQEDIRKLTRVTAFFLVARLVLYLLPMFQFPIRIQSIIVKSVHVLSIFFFIIIISRIASIILHYAETITAKTENTLDDQLLPVLSRIIKIIIWALGIIYILDSLDVNVTALLAGISIGGLAIALAAQDTVKNFFGSIMIFIDRPFQIGDWINFDNVDGTVEEVGVRSTRIRTFANSVTYVPNGMLADKVVNNWGLRQYRRFKTDIGITYNTPPDVIDAFVNGIREIIKAHPTTRKDYFEVHLNSFGASSINILLYCFFEAPDWSTELRGRHQIMHAIMILAKELGVSFAFPSQSIYVESFPGSEEDSAQFSTQNKDVMKKIKSYFRSDSDKGHEDRWKTPGGE